MIAPAELAIFLATQNVSDAWAGANILDVVYDMVVMTGSDVDIDESMQVCVEAPLTMFDTDQILAAIASWYKLGVFTLEANRIAVRADCRLDGDNIKYENVVAVLGERHDSLKKDDWK